MTTLLPSGRTLGVIGAGVMGRTLMKGLLNAGLVEQPQLWAGEKSRATCEKVAHDLGVAAWHDYHARLPEAAILLVCCKPAQIDEVAAYLRESGLQPDTLLISILAGVTTARLQTLIDNPWVRSLPNTPSIIGEGMTVICPGATATHDHLAAAERIFKAVGRCEAVEEKLLNAITALSGCGPAYMYMILEALSDAGVRLGVKRDLALQIAAQTMLGSAKMVLETGRHPAALKDDVTTPGGSTIAGLLALEDGKLRSVVARAVEEAARTVDLLGRSPH
ncbi:MAG TPA: pyrroline-5-carboxylate reductase [Bryobacteraceae bacterium]|nr:pyrroline-5-carboxylate reductase [Bryobacteraceae bacterium]